MTNNQDAPALEVLFVDNHLLVVHKPAGVPIVPDSSKDESLSEQAKAWIAAEFDKQGKVFLGVVHRLDRPVSGVVCFARTSKAAARLTEAFKAREVTKVYLGIGVGRWPEDLPAEGELRQWLRKDRVRNRVFSYSSEAIAPEGSKEALTRYRRLRTTAGRSLWRFEPHTGRSHQLRLAARSLGLPLLGDLRYSQGMAPLADRSIGLHALRLSLAHPTTKEVLTFEAPLPTGEWWDEWRESATEA